MRPHVNSAVANDGVPGCWLDEHDDPEPCARVDVDVRVDTSLADQLELGQLLEQGRPDLGAFPDQHERVSGREPAGQFIDILHMVIPDGHVMPAQFLEALQAAHGVMVIVQNRNLHTNAS